MPYTELYHHGILGQKWGVRRFQNTDGTLTAAGKKRYQNKDGTLTEAGKKRYLDEDGDLTEAGQKRFLKKNGTLTKAGKKRYLNEDGTLNDEGRNLYLYSIEDVDVDSAFQNSKFMRDYIQKNKKKLERIEAVRDKRWEKRDEFEKSMAEFSDAVKMSGELILANLNADVWNDKPRDVFEYIKQQTEYVNLQAAYDKMFNATDKHGTLLDKLDKELTSVAREWANDKTNSIPDDDYTWATYGFFEKYV